MNTISFTNDPSLAVQASMDQNTRVVLVTEHAPLVLSQNPNVVKLPILLPPFEVVGNYVDYGEDEFKYSYGLYLTSDDIIMNIFLLGVALYNKNILIYTTEDEWSKDSIPFMEVLIGVFASHMNMINIQPMYPNCVSLGQTEMTISDALTYLFMNGFIQEQSFVRYMKLIPFRPDAINTYLRSIGIDIEQVPVDQRQSFIDNIISAKAENICLTVALLGD